MDKNSNRGCGVVTVVQIVLVILKLLKFIDWSWWVVFTPTLVSVGIFSILIIVTIILGVSIEIKL